MQCAGIWSYSVLMVVVFAMAGCHKRFNQWGLVFSYGCNSGCDKSTLFGFTYRHYLTYFGPTLCCIMLVIYIGVFYRLLYHRRSQISDQQVFKRDLFLLLQFFTIFFVQLCQTLTMIMIPLFFKTSPTGVILSNFGGVANGLVNGSLLLVFNRTVKNRLFCRKFTSSFSSIRKPTVKPTSNLTSLRT